MQGDEQICTNGKRCRKRRSSIRKRTRPGKNRVSKSKGRDFQDGSQVQAGSKLLRAESQKKVLACYECFPGAKYSFRHFSHICSIHHSSNIRKSIY